MQLNSCPQAGTTREAEEFSLIRNPITAHSVSFTRSRGKEHESKLDNYTAVQHNGDIRTCLFQRQYFNLKQRHTFCQVQSYFVGRGCGGTKELDSLDLQRSLAYVIGEYPRQLLALVILH